VDLREQYIITQAIIIQALGVLGNYYFNNPEINMPESLAKLESIDWLRSAPCWKGRVIRSNGTSKKRSRNVYAMLALYSKNCKTQENKKAMPVALRKCFWIPAMALYFGGISVHGSAKTKRHFILIELLQKHSFQSLLTHIMPNTKDILANCLFTVEQHLLMMSGKVSLTQ